MPAPLKVGLIGAGGISRQHLPAFREFPEDVQLTAVCDVREDAAHARAAEAGVEAVYTDVDRLLAEADIDAVDICTTHNTHHDLTLAAAAAGKHILLEKPMACSIDEARAMVTAADEAGVTFMVGQVLRFLPHYQEARSIIQSGELGAIWAARSDSWYAALLPGSIHPSDWWGFDKQYNGGGALIMVAVHQVDLLRYWIGDVRRVTARSWTDQPLLKNGAEDRVVATLEFENGAIGHASTSYSSRTPWSWQLVVLGEEGTIYTVPGAAVPEQHGAPAMVASAARDGDAGFRKGESFEWIEGSMEGLVSESGFTNEIVHFARSIRDGTEPESSGRRNFNTMEVVHGIYESAATGQPVELTGL